MRARETRNPAEKKKLLALNKIFDPGYVVLAAAKRRIICDRRAISIPTRMSRLNPPMHPDLLPHVS
jgi:hypothetical protein